MGTNTSGQSVKNRIRRCFMTGKQCIFCGSEHPYDSKEPSVFVAMPYRPNLAMCYSWSIKNYLSDALEKLWSVDYVRIARADEQPHVGAITCEKICHQIQIANLVVVDITVPNANVMYELGLALGLEKQIVLISNHSEYDSATGSFAKDVSNYLAAEANSPRKVLTYPGVSFLDGSTTKIEEFIFQIALGTRAVTAFKIRALANTKDLPSQNDDTRLDFGSILDGAIGVAVNLIRHPEKYKEENMGDAFLNESKSESPLLSPLPDPSKEPYVIKHMNEPYKTFNSVKKDIDDVFCCIVDLAEEDEFSYLWLGYCHSRGINVIPIHRPAVNQRSLPLVCNEPAGKNNNKKEINLNKILAFDIRALWYINYEEELLGKPEHLSELLMGVFKDLINRDWLRLERNRFWGRLTTTRNINLFTGAVHVPVPKREMVGDWDQRTVSELVRYLSSTDETVTPVLEPPIYSPEYCWENWCRSKQNTSRDESGMDTFFTNYENKVIETLRDKNCIIVASADVNALTEMLLGYAYSPNRPLFFCESKGTTVNAVIALKPNPAGGPKDKNKKDGDRLGIRLYSRTASPTERLEHDQKEFRGFKIGKEGLVKTHYYAQEDTMGPPKFNLLSHLLIMRNPFRSVNTGPSPMIVILNGVSGPGTYALAELLTGSNESPEKAEQSEKMLKSLNDLLDNDVDNNKKRGVQGIVQVTIRKPSEKINEDIELFSIDLYDQRYVFSWKWCESKQESLDTPEEEESDITTVYKESNPWSF